MTESMESEQQAAMAKRDAAIAAAREIMSLRNHRSPLPA